MQDVLLVLETSCVQSSVAAWSGESLLCQAAWRAERNHSSAIFKAVRQVLDALEGRRLKEIVVGSGPGAYSGIRVALAVADGLSLVHGSRVAAFSSWNGLGLHHGEACVMSDARRGGWTWGRLENGVLTDVPAVLPAEQARVSVAECMGKGGSSGRPGNVGDCPRVSFCRGARGRVAVPGGGPQRRTSGKSGGTAVCEGSAHHPRQTSRMGREGVIKV